MQWVYIKDQIALEEVNLPLLVKEKLFCPGKVNSLAKGIHKGE